MITFLITAHDEGEQLAEVLSQTTSFHGQQTVINLHPGHAETEAVAARYADRVTIFRHTLEHSYSEHRNAALPVCNGDWIVALDGDETMAPKLAECLQSLLELNPYVDLFWVPSRNIFSGITPEDAQQWFWKLRQSEWGPLVNYPDAHGRIFKNNGKMKWVGTLHEKIHGARVQAYLLPDHNWDFIHRKTIDQQRADNNRFNAVYSRRENQGLSAADEIKASALRTS